MVAGTMTASKINATINPSYRMVAATSHASIGLQECVNTLSVSELGKPRHVVLTCRGLFFHGHECLSDPDNVSDAELNQRH